MAKIRKILLNQQETGGMPINHFFPRHSQKDLTHPYFHVPKEPQGIHPMWRKGRSSNPKGNPKH